LPDAFGLEEANGGAGQLAQFVAGKIVRFAPAQQQQALGL
jgi:hypothetical protein